MLYIAINARVFNSLSVCPVFDDIVNESMIFIQSVVKTMWSLVSLKIKSMVVAELNCRFSIFFCRISPM